MLLSSQDDLYATFAGRGEILCHSELRMEHLIVMHAYACECFGIVSMQQECEA
jgi:hypothetical protein